jgi:hypothetical protein
MKSKKENSVTLDGVYRKEMYSSLNTGKNDLYAIQRVWCLLGLLIVNYFVQCNTDIQQHICICSKLYCGRMKNNAELALRICKIFTYPLNERLA